MLRMLTWSGESSPGPWAPDAWLLMRGRQSARGVRITGEHRGVRITGEHSQRDSSTAGDEAGLQQGSASGAWTMSSALERTGVRHSTKQAVVEGRKCPTSVHLKVVEQAQAAK